MDSDNDYLCKDKYLLYVRGWIQVP